MLRSMYSATAALGLQQLYLDVISNNLANLNTPGFKGSRMSFADMFSETLSYGVGPDGTQGGVNPAQIGLGVRLGGLDTLFTQGSLQATGKSSDLAIQGDGFFVYEGPEGNLYSRDGSIDLGADGYLTNPYSGLHILGWQADDAGTIDTTQPLGPITIPAGTSEASATLNATLQGNLDADTLAGETFTTSMEIYDSLGAAHTIELTFTKDVVTNTWTWAATSTDPAITGITVNGNPIAFTPDGQWDPANPPISIDLTLGNGATTPQTITMDFSNLTQTAADSDVSLSTQDGMAPGSLVSWTVTGDGQVIGLYSNGLSETVGQIAMANFTNPSGMQALGGNLYIASANSGAAQIGVAGEGGRGGVAAGYLEMSNVDLAQEFTNMIVAQRGFQANSRVITTADEMLQELVNLKR